MKEMRTLGFICSVIATIILFCACFEATRSSLPTYELRYTPTTDQERANVAVMEQELLKTANTNVYAHDWMNMVEVAHKTACKTLCKPTLWTKINGKDTGDYHVVEK